MADEEAFLSLLIANERIGRALDTLCDPYQRTKYDGIPQIAFRGSRANQALLHTVWSAVAAVAAAAGQQFGLAS
jgi:hypothetical protein